ncbi:MAG: S8 family serine peptidase [Candidatus Eiseniibacteriota bacterium]
MRRLAIALSASALGFRADAAAFLDHPFVPGELIVAFHESAAPSAQEAVHDRLGGTVVFRLEQRPVTLVRFDASVSLEDRLAAYAADPAVVSVEPNYIGQGGFVPNDTWYAADQWHLNNTGQFGGTPGADIEAEAGWDVTLGASSVVVAVLDTGIDSDHPDFAGRIVAGWDFVNNDADPEDDQSHGTLVSGLLAANGNNSFGVAGVNQACMIMPIKVLDAGNSGTTMNLIAGVDFAAANGADVVSMSLINYPLGVTLNQALGNCKQTGAVLIACAGNGGIGDADISGPGISTHCISIGATDLNDDRAWYSGTGTKLDYVAPGDGVYTSQYNTAVDTDSWFAGCSAATPVAAGIASLLKSLEPTIVSSQVRAFFTAGAEDMVGLPAEDTVGWDQYMGDGRLNLRGTIEAYLNVVAARDVEAAARPLEVEVMPNPALGATTIAFTLPVADRVTAVIYDVAGRRVRTLVQAVGVAGRHEARWDGLDEGGAPAAPGLYFVRVQSRHDDETRKLVLTR